MTERPDRPPITKRQAHVFLFAIAAAWIVFIGSGALFVDPGPAPPAVGETVNAVCARLGPPCATFPSGEPNSTGMTWHDERQTQYSVTATDGVITDVSASSR